MRTAKRILICALAVSMTAATIWAQKTVPDKTSRQSAELDMLVDLAEMDLLADMLESLLQDEENAGSSSIADCEIPERDLCRMPGMDMGIFDGGFAMGGMDGFSGFPIMAGYGNMNGVSDMNGFGVCPMMTGGFGGMGGLCGF